MEDKYGKYDGDKPSGKLKKSLLTGAAMVVGTTTKALGEVGSTVLPFVGAINTKEGMEYLQEKTNLPSPIAGPAAFISETFAPVALTDIKAGEQMMESLAEKPAQASGQFLQSFKERLKNQMSRLQQQN